MIQKTKPPLKNILLWKIKKTVKTKLLYVNIQHNIDTTEINDLSDDEVKCLMKNLLHPSQRLSTPVREKN